MDALNDITTEILNLLKDGDNCQIKLQSTFNDFAVRLFQIHLQNVQIYANYCQRLGTKADMVNEVNRIPALPQAVFKSVEWQESFAQSTHRRFFQTSGTSIGKRGIRPVARMDVYEEACVAGLLLMLRREFPDFISANAHKTIKQNSTKAIELPFFFVKESPQFAPHSSLSWMFEFWRQRLGTNTSTFLLQGSNIVEDPLLEQIWREPDRPVFLAGTALGLWEWIQRRNRQLLLPTGSILLETGGFKNRRKELPKRELYGRLSQQFGIPNDRIINEYGMTEIFSQTYARGIDGLHVSPPWLRVRVVDPYTGEICPEGKPGVIEIVDLANVDCVLAVQTQDVGVLRNAGLELWGRVSTELRGCSVEAFRDG